jgi:hypothetical protein
MDGVKKVLIGGGLISKSISSDNVGSNFLYLFGMSFLLLLIKGVLVQITYNYMTPKLVNNINSNYNFKNFKTLNLIEAILIVILFNNLFNSF